MSSNAALDSHRDASPRDARATSPEPNPPEPRPATPAGEAARVSRTAAAKQPAANSLPPPGARWANPPPPDVESPGETRSAPESKARTSATRQEDLAEDEPEPAEDEGDAGEWTDESLPFFHRQRLQSLSAFTISSIVHAAVLIVMAYWTLSERLVDPVAELIASVVTERPEQDLLKTELDLQVEAAMAQETAAAASAVTYGAIGEVGGTGTTGSGSGSGGGGVSAPVLDKGLMQQEADVGISVPGLLDEAPSGRRLIADVPDGALGDPRAVVDTYQEAMDRITQELLWLLSKGKVLVVWSFDQSESMKDDQKEIRDRIERVYTELGLTTKTDSELLATGVTSFGEKFLVHTRRPTGELSEIRAAIDSVPTDPSGMEMLCPAVGRSIAAHREYANRTQRQMVLIVVTDESGDRSTNDAMLEQAIAEARAARCRIYVLGREAVFGYPYAYMSWQHPQTRRVHWLQIDRGPEAAFVEQLQTDGFHRRYDAHPSGFGPYEQTRMARETGGVFFMLPSLETNLVRGEKRRYELESMRAYVPDMRSRIEVLSDRDNSRLRLTIWKVINDLNPYVPEISKIIEMRVEFSPNPAEFVRQARIEQAKALAYLPYLARAQKELEKIRPLRQQETSPRWQANYDIIYAQLIAYQARIYEYGAYLEYFLKNPKRSPLTKAPNLTLVNWDIRTRKELLRPEESQPYIDQATRLFQEVIQEHAGTPWAARADLELKRGFGVELVEDYEPPYPQPSGVPIPIPKL